MKFARELKSHGLLYALEGVFPTWVCRFVPNVLIDVVDWVFWDLG